MGNRRLDIKDLGKGYFNIKAEIDHWVYSNTVCTYPNYKEGQAVWTNPQGVVSEVSDLPPKLEEAFEKYLAATRREHQQLAQSKLKPNKRKRSLPKA